MEEQRTELVISLPINKEATNVREQDENNLTPPNIKHGTGEGNEAKYLMTPNDIVLTSSHGVLTKENIISQNNEYVSGTSEETIENGAHFNDNNVNTIEENDGSDRVYIDSNKSVNNNEEQSNDTTIGECVEPGWRVAYQKNLAALMQLCNYVSDEEYEETDGKSRLEETDNTEITGEKCMVKVVESSENMQNQCTADSVTKSTQTHYRKSDKEQISSSEDSEESSEDTSSSSSSSTSSSSEESDSEDSDSSVECVQIVERKEPIKEKNVEAVPRTKGEIGLEDLPPIEDLYITVPETECVEIGVVMSIVDSLVVVQSKKDTPALDLDSVLFLDKGHSTLGQVFDVFGPVCEPCYCVRFNSSEHARERGIQKGMPVYFAPRTEHSTFVFVADLIKAKGSDASWEDNNEPPRRFLDFSDDEEERESRRTKIPAKRDSKQQQPRNRKRNMKWNNNQSHSGDFKPRTINPWAGPAPCEASSSSSSFFTGPQPLLRPATLNRPQSLNPPNVIQSDLRIKPWAVPRATFPFSVNMHNDHSQQQQPFHPGMNPFVGSPPPPLPLSNFVTPPRPSNYPPPSHSPYGPLHMGPRGPNIPRPPPPPGW